MRNVIPWVVNAVVFWLSARWVEARVLAGAEGLIARGESDALVFAVPAALFAEPGLLGEAGLLVLAAFAVCWLIGRAIQAPSTWTFLLLSLPLGAAYGVVGERLWQQL